MKKAAGLCLFLACVLTQSAFAQTAPQRSEELCEALKQSTAEKGLEFKVTRPGACHAQIDRGYTLTVSYNESMLAVGLMVQFSFLDDISAFWLRLSVLDNLCHSALGTKQEAVFDELNKLAKQVSKEMVPLMQQGKADATTERFGKTQRADLMVTGTARILFLQVSAHPKGIDRMKRDRKREATGEIPEWRKVLGMALQAFAAGAKGYGEAYRSYYENPRSYRITSCYTNFAGQWAFTNCY